VNPEEAGGILEAIRRLVHVRVKGLMTIAPLVTAPVEARPYFRKLRELRDQLSTIHYSLSTLSMGMSDDFEVAIEEGSTMVRIGRAIFGG